MFCHSHLCPEYVHYIRWRLYNIWLKNGKPNDPTNHLLLQKKQNKKEFRWAVRIEVARQKEIEKVNIMEARSNNMELFHKLIQKNRNKGLEHIQDINVNGKTYSGSDEVLLGFQEHFRSLSTFDKSAHKEIRYHQQVMKVSRFSLINGCYCSCYFFFGYRQD
jgi:hypothetical protein